MNEKTCYMCKKTLPVGDFGSNLKHKDGLQSYCKHCKRIYDSRWRQKNRRYVNRYARIYQRNKRIKELEQCNKTNFNSDIYGLKNV